MLPWLICGLAIVVACLAVRRVRALARRLDRVKQVQWELSYQLDALTARVDAMLPPERRAAAEGSDRAATGSPAVAPPRDTAFVPLSSVRRT